MNSRRGSIGREYIRCARRYVESVSEICVLLKVKMNLVHKHFSVKLFCTPRTSYDSDYDPMTIPGMCYAWVLRYFAKTEFWCKMGVGKYPKTGEKYPKIHFWVRCKLTNTHNHVIYIYTSMCIDFGVNSLYFGCVTIVLSLYLPRAWPSYEWPKRTD